MNFTLYEMFQGICKNIHTILTEVFMLRGTAHEMQSNSVIMYFIQYDGYTHRKVRVPVK